MKQLLRDARVRRGLGQAELADAIGTSQAAVSFIESGHRAPRVDTVARWLHVTNHHLVAFPSVYPTAAEVGVVVTDALQADRSDDGRRALLSLADALLVAEPVEAVLLCAEAPASTAVPLWDATIAALVDWRLGERGLPVPSWVAGFGERLENPTTLASSPFDMEPPRNHVPLPFLQRNVLVDAAEWESV
ncbi:DNA-binding XRE family transcriptional regulator [Microcella alkaliphila]|uniref:DNA-binding XRE family transcriptional regulator n=1 Tax=Microcella alkaliphila TaxID=279828 RepID=A0A4Q7TUD0_9MICO|nr:helix-turn-helix transcriptional regulator [Microcella alkaliphila]RZT64363.1 DNA-binding XRE family transcriptional regulator [Microcella alkaliphila]